MDNASQVQFLQYSSSKTVPLDLNTFTEIFISPYGFELLSSVLSFHSVGLHFFEDGFSGNELPPLLCIWGFYNFSLTFEGILLDIGFLVDIFFL